MKRLALNGELGLVDAAAVLGRHPITVRRWVQRGILPAKRRGQDLYVPEDRVLAIVERERRIAKLKAKAQKARAA